MLGRTGDARPARELPRARPRKERMKRSATLIHKLLVPATISLMLSFGPHAALRAQVASRAAVPPSAPPIFSEMSESAGVDFRHYTGATGNHHLPEITGSGAALFDFDGDGDLDLFLVQASTLEPGSAPSKTLYPWREARPPRSRLYRNDLTIEKDGSRRVKFTDVTEASGIRAEGYGMGAAVGDVNNDGRPDLYVTNLGSNQLYMNEGGGVFKEATKTAGADDARWSTSAAFFDYDRDGWLDLFIVNYVEFDVKKSPACYANTTEREYCTPHAFNPAGNRLLRNKGDGTFEDATARAGVDKEFGNGLGVVTADFDGDGWIDIYVANDGDPNQLWMNRRNGTFTNEALLAGAAVNRDGQAEAGMGVDAGDFDEDGDEDLFVTHLMEETNTLYVNQGEAVFEDRTYETGVVAPSGRHTGFGTLWFDYDNDGLLDLLITNGAVRKLQDLARKGDSYPYKQPNQLLRNAGGGRFQDRTNEAGEAFTQPVVGRGAAFGDIDNDGDTDVVVSNNNGRARLFMNTTGARSRWLGLRLVGGKGGRDMLGARVEVALGKGRKTIWRRARTDGGYLSAHDPRVLVGLGGAERAERVRVHWPSGKVEEWSDLPSGEYVTLAEGAAKNKREAENKREADERK